MFSLNDVSRVMDTQVSVSQMWLAVAGIFATYYGGKQVFRLTRWASGLAISGVVGVLKLVPFLFLSAFVFFVGGLGSVGFSIGELLNVPKSKEVAAVVPSVDNIQNITRDKDVDVDKLQAVLSYFEKEQSLAQKKQAETLINDYKFTPAVAITEEPTTRPGSSRVGFTSMFGGIACCIVGIVSFIRGMQKHEW